jgi:hypothetical protein
MEDTYILKSPIQLQCVNDAIPDAAEDILERRKILLQFEEILPILEENNKSRRCVATFMTEKEGQLSYACPSLIHIFIEDDRVCIKAYFRSLNIKRNFEYDKNTLRLLLQQACESLGKLPNYIKIFIGCPHEA